MIYFRLNWPFILVKALLIWPPILGIFAIARRIFDLKVKYRFDVRKWVKCLDILPTFSLMDILLSLRITIKLLWSSPAQLSSASYARPPVNAPSPITAITLPFSPLICFAFARPTASEIETLE